MRRETIKDYTKLRPHMHADREAAPEGYRPPRGAEELLKRYGKGERYFAEAELDGASLSGASLSGANLSESRLSRADLSGAKLDGAKLDWAALDSANLSHASMVGASLYDAELSGADLLRAKLAGARLTGASLRNAELSFSDLNGAMLKYADFDGANLTDAEGVKLDLTRVRNARFSPIAADPWSVLRRRYTGVLFSFNLLLLVVFFTPYLLRAMMWIGVNRSQTAIIETTARLREASERLRSAGDSHAEWLAAAAERVSRVQPCLAGHCREWSVWQILIGMDRGPLQWVLALSLIVYNLFRGLLTWHVGPLADEEQRSGYSPEASDYEWCTPLHRAVRVLFFVAVASLVWHLIHWLTTPVWLPR